MTKRIFYDILYIENIDFFMFRFSFHRHSPGRINTGEISFQREVDMIKKVYCPDCGKWLLSVADGTTGVIHVWCRQCRSEKRIDLK